MNFILPSVIFKRIQIKMNFINVKNVEESLRIRVCFICVFFQLFLSHCHVKAIKSIMYDKSHFISSVLGHIFTRLFVNQETI